jgi:nitrilase
MTRAIENQVFFSSLNRAGENYGNSLFCYPWMDDKDTPIRFPNHDEALCLITLDRATLMKARSDYTFLDDRLPDYGQNALKIL